MSETERDLRSMWAFLDNVAFTQGYADAGGTRTRYVNAGPKDAPVVVMIHGMGGTWENFIGNFAEFSKHFNTYAYDLMGHGYTDKPNQVYDANAYVGQLEGFLEAMNIEKVNLFGLSMGGWTSTLFTARHPEKVEKLLVMSAWGRPQPKPTEEQQAKLKEVLGQRLKSVENPTFEGIDKVFETLIADPKMRMQDLLAVRLRVYQQENMVQTMKNVFMGIGPEHYNQNLVTDEILKSISRPTMLMACVDNPDIFLDMAYEYKELIPDVEWVEILGASHWPQWETKEIVNEAAIKFFKS